ncbi:ring-1,2-phenylacetyl-CoA epoxidase subunit PaaE [Cupriavidus metallidurans]|jgi:ring-1,2-phenylacetyl-CoA epoxidase subunit PaaE|uniref:Subunit of the phenylacetyl-CoA oxygenase/reductase n=1 Tax=Cupriavidus metallidurans (strain ATCC 43123 / DSM 2839 / NBRC 102507 / CH34) TaxID=266264 RepID=Q1LHY1_CUPMC|nr:1,2-phenylacetyl-CoA epoxidase subunit PaaE [Cupriavidus metallidurans]ABF10245.1 subunit of the phenylacetyl-CoA oxygenase/reductase [Cupriavidus metallidurans CH34]KWW33546.1 1,2-phenylacetyl-CoA epoxidase, subunit E [Cupriavidus metallidurans]MDE4919701.1 phenylacetate-CoA oxygenase/reductase subunit PaaK [Cupriavidus metallidurans]QGS28975.1 phenylacetate-CoA oxygenase/reductase subunit PaaK [Cupriavidus metallidurans]UBM10783.1 phenylacetate-CoA oxygenase/reductase subunit PaaK [Cupria
MTPQFHPLRVAQVRPETSDTVSIAFDVPDALRDAYRFTQGQFLTLKAPVGGNDVRRSYSICSGVQDYAESGELRVAVKLVDDGVFSTWVHDNVEAGQTLDVMTPDGRFHVPLDPAASRHYVAFAAGSGITPVLSLIRTTLAVEPNSRFTLVYGNRSVDTIIFSEALEDLKNQYLSRFTLYHVLSRQPQEVDLLHGRLDRERVSRFLDALIPIDDIDAAFVCGPASMIDEVEEALKAAGLDPHRIHAERFGVPLGPRREIPVSLEGQTGTAELVVVLDGKQHKMRLPLGNAKVLDTALAAGLDLPYACKGGVCCTCRAKVLEGEVEMEKNYTLEPWEMEKGFVLTCQARAVTPRVVVSYDER